MDAFVYSTEHDTFGIAVVEAMAAGIPVFVNDWGVMREISEDGKYAKLYESKNEQDLLSKFLLFYNNKESYKTYAKDTVLRVRSLYSIEKHLDNLSCIYTKLLEK